MSQSMQETFQLTGDPAVCSTDWFGKLTDQQINELAEGIWRERSKREEAKCKREDKCPECLGTGYTGSETDHEPCERCATTGRYFSNTELSDAGGH